MAEYDHPAALPRLGEDDPAALAALEIWYLHHSARTYEEEFAENRRAGLHPRGMKWPRARPGPCPFKYLRRNNRIKEEARRLRTIDPDLSDREIANAIAKAVEPLRVPKPKPGNPPLFPYDQSLMPDAIRKGLMNKFPRR